MKTIVILDNGHGFDTRGKASPDGKYQEWAWAREMADLIAAELTRRGIETRIIVTERHDISLRERARRVNAICDQYGTRNCILLSIHSNANSCDGKWHDGQWSGFTAAVSLNASEKSKQLADHIWARAIEAGLKGNRAVIERPGRRYIAQDLAICRDTKCPAVLTESAFHDTHDGVRTLTDRKQTIALAHVQGILDYIGTRK